MKTEEFKRVYAESRNGANFFVRHWAVRKFQLSDGVQDCADCGLHWFLDVAATELPKLIPIGDMGIVHLKVTDSVANLTMELHDDSTPVWSRLGVSTDCPEGDWSFWITNEGYRFAMILPEEY